jgi:cyclophilin family peptidyl-prolyl cis-trans isomerase
MKTTNIILTIVAGAIIIFIIWIGGSQKSQKTPEPTTTPAASPETNLTVTGKTTTNKESMTTAIITTNKGVITLELFADKTPKTVANFTKLANAGFYNGTRFHRVIKGFMIQGGDPLSKDTSMQSRWGTGGPGYQFEDEISADNSNVIGTIAMANSGPNTNGSQFFINTANNNFLDTKHTSFGRVAAGMEVVTAIENTKTMPGDRPVEDMIIEKIEIK